MRSLGSAVALLLVGCTALNPAFGDDAGATATGEASGSGDPSGSPSSTGRPPTTESTSDATTVGPPDTSANTTSPDIEDVPPSFDPFRVPVVFPPRPATYFDFVARVEIEAPYLEEVPLAWLDFQEPDTNERTPFEVVSHDATTGRLDAWVLLHVWDDDAPTVVELAVGVPQGPPVSPWDTYEHVWHLDQEDALDDATGNSLGDFSGYANGEGVLPGVVGRAREFDGDNDLAEVSGVTEASMTLAAYGWVRVDTLPSGVAPLFARSDGLPSEELPNDNAVDWAVTVDQEGQVRMLMRVGSGVVASTFGVPIPEPATGWHHYGVVSSGETGQTRFYIDGGSTQLLTAPLASAESVPNLSIGGWFGEEASFVGAVDEVMWIHRELPLAWMEAVHDNQRTPSETFELGAPMPY